MENSKKEDFNKRFTLEERQEKANAVLEKHPDKLPVVVQQASDSKLELPDFKEKFLVTHNLTVSKFILEIRKRVNLKPEHALFIFIKQNTVPSSAQTMKEVYDKFKDEDNFLKIYFKEEPVMGGF